MKKIILSGLALGFAALLIYSGRQAWRACGDYRAEAQVHGSVMEYKPQDDEAVNWAVIGLREKYPDAVGWLTVPGTNIDYPFVWYEDNDYYLRRDLNGEPAKPGTIFMDYRCAGDGSGYSIIYGHNMKSGAMFGTLGRFEDKAFFDAHPEGYILFEDGWHTIQFTDFLIVREDDSTVYSVPEGADRTVALSTCSYAFQGARMVLLGKII